MSENVYQLLITAQCYSSRYEMGNVGQTAISH